MACMVASPSSQSLSKMASKQRPFVFEFSSENTNKNKPKNLQEAFESFRRGRQREIKNAKLMEERALSQRKDTEKMDLLRAKFLERVKKYFGVPYAKRYHDEDSPFHNAPLFLDCCGLVRRVLLDLKNDFGFKVGGGNQAYQFDTLPISIKEEDMKPGDLVFISGTYYKKPGKKWKKQRHDMVHVEVWLGDGEKTIGARWQKGVVQVFDSYKFVSKGYYNMEYHFKSIDTWLMGICKSFCPEHPWKSSKYNPSKRSIFSPVVEEEDDLNCDAAEEEEDENQQQQNKHVVDESVSILSVVNQDKMFDIDGKCYKDASKLKTEGHKLLDNDDGLKLQQTVREFESNDTKQDKITDCHDKVCKENERDTENEAKSNLSKQNDLSGCKLSVVDDKHGKEDASQAIKNAKDRVDDIHQQDERSTSLEIEIQSRELSNKDENVNEIAKICKEIISSIVEVARQRSNSLPSSLNEIIDTDKTSSTPCFCPECCVRKMSCMHTYYNCSDDHYSDEYSLDNSTERSLRKSKEISTSLECFEVIVSPEHRQQVEENLTSCPVEKADGNASGGSTGSPPNDKKSGERDSNGSPSKNNNNNRKKGSPPKPVRDGSRSRMRQIGQQPAYYVSPGNGSSMVEATLQSLGWRKIEDRNDESFKLKWVECKNQIDYSNFREGEQLVNHISNIGLLTTKLGLLCSLEEYERVLDKVGSKQRIQLSEFVPETIKLTNLTEKLKFVNDVYKEGEVWICKPIGQNQGKGIYMINSSQQLRERLRLNVENNAAETNGRRNRAAVKPPQGRIIQRYIMNPLLLNGFKFDVRAYMFIASTTPYVVLYRPGYIRLSCEPYSPYTADAANTILTAHLTNQYIQKKHPLYSSMKDDTVWSYERLQSYIDEHLKDKELAENWVFTAFTKRMQQIMLTCFHSVRTRLHRRSGFFDLLGFDFMVDENFKVWLIEVNVNPSLSTSCQVLKDLMPEMVDSTVKIALEIFEKTKKRRPVFPLENMNSFSLLYNGEGKS